MSKQRPLTNPDELEANRLAQARAPDLPLPAQPEPAAPINGQPQPIGQPDKPRSRRGPDKELQAMAKIDQMLSEFDEAAQDRILDWINNRRCPNGVNP